MHSNAVQSALFDKYLEDQNIWAPFVPQPMCHWRFYESLRSWYTKKGWPHPYHARTDYSILEIGGRDEVVVLYELFTEVTQLGGLRIVGG